MEAEVYCDIIARDIRELMKKVGCSDIASGLVFLSIRHKPEHVARFLENDVQD